MASTIIISYILCLAQGLHDPYQQFPSGKRHVVFWSFLFAQGDGQVKKFEVSKEYLGR